MSVSENLQRLRKQNGITQEQLADELGVSRQAVSKWETGEAYPETEKLLLLCDKFGVSCDELLRGTVEGKGFTNEKKKIDVFSRMIALGVALILAGVSACVLLCGIGAFYEKDLYDYLGGAAILLFVAAAVFLFVFAGISWENYRKVRPSDAGVPQEDVNRLLRKFPVVMASCVAGILVLVVAVILVFALFGDANTKRNDLIVCIATSGFLFVLALLVGGICLTGIRRDLYCGKDIAAKANGKTQKITEAANGAIMMTATIVFLLCGFVWNVWHPAWVVFPVGGILCGIVSAVSEAVGGKKPKDGKEDDDGQDEN